MSRVKIDLFCHILPPAYFERMTLVSTRGAYMQKRVREIPAMVDLDVRFRMMDLFDDYVQVLSLAAPPIEALGRPDSHARSGAAGQRHDGRDRRQASRPLPGVHRLAADEQSRGDGQREIDRADQRPRRDRHPDLHAMSTAGRSTTPSSRRCSQRMARDRPADLDAPDPHRRVSPITRRSRSRSSSCGGCSAGRTRPASRWRASCLPATSTACRACRSSRTTWAG